MKGFAAITVLLGVACVQYTIAQNDRIENVWRVSNSVDKFATTLLDTTAKELRDNSVNVALSPYTVWTLMTIIAEGADGETLKQLQNALILPQNMEEFRSNYRELTLYLLNNQNGVDVDITNAFFVTDEFPLNTTFQKITRDAYNVDIKSVNFRDNAASLEIINKYISDATRQRIQRLVNPDDIADAEVFMTSVLYFKGKWRFPFNKTATMSNQPFYADDGQTPIGSVEMMYHSAPYPYTAVSELKSFVAELPYGDGDKYGMYVLVPSRNTKLEHVLTQLKSFDFAEIIRRVEQSAKEFEDEEIDVYLPKFTVTSEYTLNVVLNKMGITDVFRADRALITGISKEQLFLNRLLQKAIIDVDEEGTVATSAAGGGFSYKTMKPKLEANKPFAFFIIDKITRSIIFEGKVSNPKGICASCTGL